MGSDCASTHPDANLCRLLDTPERPIEGSSPWTARVGSVVVAWSGSGLSAPGVALDAAARAKVRDLTLKEPLLVNRLAAGDGGACSAAAPGWASSTP